MTRSFRTDAPRVAARRKLQRNSEGEVLLPKIIAHKPRRGDIHPISARPLEGVLRRHVPLEYLSGLRRIELRARLGVVGDPFAYYLPEEKTIILYSLPEQWSWAFDVPNDLLAKMKRFFAEVYASPSATTVRWPAREVMALWYFVEVVGHELGHHFRNQYRIRRGSGRARRHEEFVAELHSERFYQALKRQLRQRASAHLSSE